MAEEASDKELLSQLRSKDPHDCEKIIGNLWSNMGYCVNVTKGSKDRSIDVEAEKSDPFERTQLIQVKRYAKDNKVGSQTIRNYKTLYDQRPDADRVVLVTTGYFTSDALELATDLNVDILDGLELIQLIRGQAPDMLKKLSDGPQQTKDYDIGIMKRRRLKVELTELKEKREETNSSTKKRTISHKIENIESILRDSSS